MRHQNSVGRFDGEDRFDADGEGRVDAVGGGRIDAVGEPTAKLLAAGGPLLHVSNTMITSRLRYMLTFEASYTIR